MTRRELMLSGVAAVVAGVSGQAISATEKQALRYGALALQVLCDPVNQDKSLKDAQRRIDANIARVEGQLIAAVRYLKGFNGYDVKLAVLPEYWMTGFPYGESREEWQAKAAIPMQGRISDMLAKMAQGAGVYLCSNQYETDPNFPELYFQSNVIYAPNGNVVLRYRRMISLYTPSPYDVWDAYLDAYGAEAVFPVASTEIGTLGTMASEEVLYPEIARAVSLKGAEVLLHPTSEVGAPGLTPKHIAKKARAVENIAYVVSANSAKIIGTTIASASADAMSIVLDSYGRTLAEAGFGETFTANAVLDIGALRETRRKPGMTNTISRLPAGAFAPEYANAQYVTKNRMGSGKMMTHGEARADQEAVIQRMVESGVLK